MNSGKVIIFSAPSGAGKSTVVQHLLTNTTVWNFLFPQLRESQEAKREMEKRVLFDS